MEDTLGKRIILHRKKLGMTQDRLAEQLGVTAQAVSKWENDQSCPDISMLPKLAEIFGISIDALLGIVPQEKVHEAEVVEPENREDDTQESNGIHIQKGNWEFQLDNSHSSSFGMALWVLLVGGLLLAANLLSWDVGFWEILWPSGLLIFGLFGVLPRFSLFRLSCVLFGAYFLLSNLNILPFPLGKELLLPIFLLIFGVNLLVDALRKSKENRYVFIHKGKHIKSSHFDIKDGCLECNLSFGQKHYTVDSPRLSHGQINVNFGELEIDLSSCEEITAGCTIEANCAFGELELKVPRHWRVEAISSTSFGNFEMKGFPDPAADTIINLDANASFGEICVTYI